MVFGKSHKSPRKEIAYLMMVDGIRWENTPAGPCWKILSKCVKSKKKKSEDDGIQLAAVVTKEEAIDEIRKEEEGVGR